MCFIAFAWKSKFSPPEEFTMTDLPETIGTPISGGFAIVRIVKYPDGRIVARKELRNYHDPVHLARFKHEVKIISSLDHQYVVKILDHNLDELPPWFEMPVLKTWNEYTKISRWNYQDIKIVFYKILEGVRFVHANKVYHRDITPGNVLFDANGNPILTDFGLGLKTGTDFSRHTRTDEGFGTPGFAAPEQYEKGRFRDADQRSDIFGLGNLLTYMFNNTSNPNTIAIIRNTKVKQFIHKCIKENPGERYSNLDDMISAFVELEFHDEKDLYVSATKELKDEHGISDQCIAQLRSLADSITYVRAFFLESSMESIIKFKEHDSALFRLFMNNFFFQSF